MAALFILLVCVKFCNLAGGESSNVRQSTSASQMIPSSSTPVKLAAVWTTPTIKPSLKVTLSTVNEFSQPHVATRTHKQSNKDSGPSRSSVSGSGVIQIVTKVKDFHLQTNHATKQKSSAKDSVLKKKETASNTIKVHPSYYRSSMNNRPKNVETSDVLQNIFSSNRIGQTSIYPVRKSKWSLSISKAASKNAETRSDPHSDIVIKPSSFLPHISPSPEARVTRTKRTATMALQPTPTYLFPSHDKLKPSVFSSFPLSNHEGITFSSKESYATSTSQSVLRLPLYSAPTGSDITNKLPSTRPFTSTLIPIMPASVRPLSCGRTGGEACVCYNCNKSKEKCCTETHSSKRLKQGIVMEITQITVEKFIQMEDATSQTISRIIAQECKNGQKCSLLEETSALNRLKRDISADVIKSSPQIEVIKHSQKHQVLARTFSKDQMIKIVARPSSNSITRLLAPTRGPSVNLAVKRYSSKENTSLSVKVIFFSLSTSNPKSRSLEAAMYSLVTSGVNTTRIVESKKLLNILKGKKATLEKQLNFTIKSFKVWNDINKRGAGEHSASLFTSPTHLPRPTPSGTIMYPASSSLSKCLRFGFSFICFEQGYGAYFQSLEPLVSSYHFLLSFVQRISFAA